MKPTEVASIMKKAVIYPRILRVLVLYMFYVISDQ